MASSDEKQGAKARSTGRAVSEIIGYAAMVGAVWLAWEIVKTPVIQRGPPLIALRLAPSSPDALQRAAEDALVRERNPEAIELARESLLRAPFNARTMRVLGLATAREGDLAVANEILTLAGNWSLRDDPTHAWLIEQRLRQGDYMSAFAHADTLARRRVDVQPRVFELFTTAATTDRRSVAPLARIVAARPHWRADYLTYLLARPERAPAALSLAVALQQTDAPLTNAELQTVYEGWIAKGQTPAVKLLRELARRPDFSHALQNGDWEDKPETEVLPFAWRLGSGPGITSLVSEEVSRSGNNALQVQYSGYSDNALVEQSVALAPGRYVFDGDEKPEGDNEMRHAWAIACIGTRQNLPMSVVAPGRTATGGWKPFALTFEVPAADCALQRLYLTPTTGQDRGRSVVWFDNLRISDRAVG